MAGQRLRLFLLVAFAVSVGCTRSPADAPAPADVPAPLASADSSPSEPVDDAVGPWVAAESFEEELAPYGQWVDSPDGRAWEPSVDDTEPDFEPYASDGEWQYAELGWVWVSDFPWGWAPFHYGTWELWNGRWIWIPGSVWGPGWVSWVSVGAYVGWAPLGPGWNVHKGTPFAFASRPHFGHGRERLALAQLPAGDVQRWMPLSSPHALGNFPVSPIAAGPAASGIPRPLPVEQLPRVLPPPNLPGMQLSDGLARAHPYARHPLTANEAHLFQTSAVEPPRPPMDAPRPFAPAVEPVRTAEAPLVPARAESAPERPAIDVAPPAVPSVALEPSRPAMEVGAPEPVRPPVGVARSAPVATPEPTQRAWEAPPEPRPARAPEPTPSLPRATERPPPSAVSHHAPEPEPAHATKPPKR